MGVCSGVEMTLCYLLKLPNRERGSAMGTCREAITLRTCQPGWKERELFVHAGRLTYH